MSSNVKTFLARVNVYRNETVPERIKQRVTAVAMEATRGVVRLSPVDTGRLKGNWQVSLGVPKSGEIERFDKSAVGSVAGNPSLAETLSVMRGWRMDQMFWIHNGVPYAVYQEEGTEMFAGRHMVARTVARLERWFG